MDSERCEVPRAIARPSEAGLTVIEMVVAVGMLVVIALFAIREMMSSHILAQENQLRRVALEAAESEIERIHGLQFREAAGQLTNRTFTVPGLPARSGGVPHGSVVYFLDETDANNPAKPVHNLILDIDGDEVGNETLTTTDRYRFLPIRVDVTYPSNAGPELTVSITTVIAPEKFIED